MAQKQQKQLMSTLNVLYYADLYVQKHKVDSNWKIQKTYLRCQKRNCPILRLASALSNRNLERAQSRKGSYFKTCTSCKRYWESSSSLKETKNRISHSTTSGRKRSLLIKLSNTNLLKTEWFMGVRPVACLHSLFHC